MAGVGAVVAGSGTGSYCRYGAAARVSCDGTGPPPPHPTQKAAPTQGRRSAHTSLIPTVANRVLREFWVRLSGTLCRRQHGT